MHERARTLSSAEISVVDDQPESTVRTSEAINERGEVIEVIHLGDGYVDINGYIFHDDWDEIDPPGSDDQPEIPHEVVMAEIFEMLKMPVDQAEG
jgi:hypothetical protein